VAFLFLSLSLLPFPFQHHDSHPVRTHMLASSHGFQKAHSVGYLFCRKPKTKRAKRAMEKREAKIVENPKSAMFIRGHNTSAVINEVLTDLVK